MSLFTFADALNNTSGCYTYVELEVNKKEYDDIYIYYTSTWPNMINLTTISLNTQTHHACMMLIIEVTLVSIHGMWLNRQINSLSKLINL